MFFYMADKLKNLIFVVAGSLGLLFVIAVERERPL